MGLPNEPGPPRTGDGTGSTNGSNGAKDGGDVPPWQRGSGSSGGSGPRPRPSDGPRAGAAAGHSPGPDARLNRFIAGGPPSGPTSGPAPAPAREPAPTKNLEAAPQNRPEVYASELPDLSGSAPRGARKPGSERTAVEPSNRPASPAARASAASRSQGPVRASMQVRRFDPWSVLKVSLVLSVALFFVWMIAIAFLYLVLGGMGVWSKLNSNVGDLLTSASGSGGELVSSGTIFGGAALIGLVNIVLLTAMATCGAFIYNLTTDLVGGIEVTLADRD
ncbi:MAG: hypothetical protein QOK02_324 [Mycobacterium sp.]|nr:hypothetical protein [Mycobacterium sp.]